jgi:hypothetical protein
MSVCGAVSALRGAAAAIPHPISNLTRRHGSSRNAPRIVPTAAIFNVAANRDVAQTPKNIRKQEHRQQKPRCCNGEIASDSTGTASIEKRRQAASDRPVQNRCGYGQRPECSIHARLLRQADRGNHVHRHDPAA